jgi:hypothetical protein
VAAVDNCWSNSDALTSMTRYYESLSGHSQDEEGK